MEIVLDTNVLLWCLFDDDRLPKHIKRIIENENNNILYSPVSLWEIEIKHNKHPDLMPYSAEEIYSTIVSCTDFYMERIRPEYLVILEDIIKKGIHNDPFDQLIIAMATFENAKLITSDSIFNKYKDGSVDILCI